MSDKSARRNIAFSRTTGARLRWVLAALCLVCTSVYAQSGIVGFWKFDEGSGTVTADSSGFGNTGTLVSSPTWASSEMGASALTFNGTTNYVNVPNTSGSLDNLKNTGMTIAGWVKATGVGGGGGGRIMEKGSWFFATAPSGSNVLVRLTIQDTGQYQSSASTIPLNTWVHVAATWTGASPGSASNPTIHIYINGTQSDSTSPNYGSGSMDPTDAGSASIGNRAADHARGFAGSIDDLRVFNRVLTASELTALADSTAPSSPTAPHATAVSGSQINLSWTAATDNIGVTSYLIERCQGSGCSSFAQIGTSTGVTYSDTGLAVGTSYSYRVRAADLADNTSAYSSTISATTTSTADTTAPSIPGGLQVVGSPTSSQINLSWTASTDNVAVTGYKLERCNTASCTFSAFPTTITGTTYSDTGLTASTAYTYRVRATDAAGNLSGYSNTLNATTAAVASPISFIQSKNNSPNNAALATLSASFATAAQVAGDLNVVAVGWGSDSVTIKSVTDTKGNTYVLAAGPTVFPGVGTEAIYYAKNVVAAAAGGNSVTVTFNSAVQFPDLRIASYRGLSATAPFDKAAAATGTSTMTTSGPLTTSSPNEVLVASNWIALGTTQAGDGFVSREISGWDGDILEDKIVTSAGTYTATAPVTLQSPWMMQVVAFRATGAVDSGAPTTPANLVPAAASDLQINLKWDASTDDVGVSNYLVERCVPLSTGCTFASVGTPKTNTYIDASVAANSTYNYRVSAFDAAGHQSGYSNTASAATVAARTYNCPNPTGPTVCYFYDDAGRLSVVQHDSSTRSSYVLDPAGNRTSFINADTTVPSVPTNFTGHAVSATEIDLTWTAATDTGLSPVTGYYVYRDGVQLGTPTAASFNDTGLTGSTCYNYSVAAHDGSSNVSAQTTPPKVICTFDITAPGIPQSVTAGAVGTTEIDVSWLASIDNPQGSPAASGVTGYKIYKDGSATPLPTLVTTTTYKDTGLAAASTHSYRVAAVDGAGNTSALSASASATTGTPPPASPTVPTNVAASAGTTQINVSWSPSTDIGGPGLAGYKIYRNASLLTQTSATSYADTSAGCTSSYSYSVAAYDTAGNTSAQSGATPAVQLTAGAISTPTGFSATPASTGAAVYLTWNAVTESCGTITGYRIFRNGTRIDSASIAYNDLNLTPGTTYSYYVQAVDALGRVSGQTSTITISIPALPGVPVWTKFLDCVRSQGCIPENTYWYNWTQEPSEVLTMSWSSTGTVTRYGFEIDEGTGFVDENVGAVTSASYTLFLYHSVTFRVRACNSVGCSAYSPEIAAQMDFN